jgi:sugar/nucleoside kinase (ribokinase family)
MDPAPESSSPRSILAGRLTRDFVILPDGQPLLDVPGGNLVYAAAGLAVWEPDPPPGLVARVGEDYPQGWIDEYARRGFDTRGIRVLPQAVDVRSFFAYTDRTTRADEDPIAHFARIGHPFPRALFGYQKNPKALDSRTRLSLTSLHQADFIPEYLDATIAHICALDYLSHSLLPAVLRQAGFANLTLEPSPGYMNATFWDDVPSLLTGLTAFMPSREDLDSLFQGRTRDPWEMAAALTGYGCELVVIKCGQSGQLLYDSASRSRWEIPPYPANVVDPTGAGDAFCGGFLAGYRRTYDPLEAVLYGNISASLAIEGHGPFYAMDALPGLAQARLEALRPAARKL